MTPERNIERILLAIESSDLESVARAYCAAILPDCSVGLLSLEEFSHALDRGVKPGEFPILMLHADERGHLEQGLPIVHSIMNSTAPVLVTRCSRGGSVPGSRINRVVVPLDGSTTAGQAIPLASSVARELDVPVRFLMVIDPARVIPPAYAYDPDAWGMIEGLRQTSHWALSQAEAAMERDGVTAGSDLMFGPINASLSANIHDGDLVVMTTHGPERHRQRDRESVALRTLVSVPQPMLIMRAETEKEIVVDGYLACSWVEPLQQTPARNA